MAIVTVLDPIHLDYNLHNPMSYSYIHGTHTECPRPRYSLYIGHMCLQSGLYATSWSLSAIYHYLEIDHLSLSWVSYSQFEDRHNDLYFSDYLIFSMLSYSLQLLPQSYAICFHSNVFLLLWIGYIMPLVQVVQYSLRSRLFTVLTITWVCKTWALFIWHE